MLKVELKDFDEKDFGKVFFCDAVQIYEAGNFKFCTIINKRAKVKSCQIPFNPSQYVIVSEDK